MVLPSPSRRPLKGGILFKLLVGLVAFAGMLVLGWMLLLPGLLTSALERRTGFPAKVVSFYANPFKGDIDLLGLTLMNPAGFSPRPFVEVRQFNAKTDTASFFGDRPVIDEAFIDVERVTVVTNADGSNNVDLIYKRLAPLAENTNAKGKPVAAAPVAPEPLRFYIRRLEIRFDEIVLVDLRGPRPVERTVHLRFHHTYQDVTSTSQFASETLPGLAVVGKALQALIPGDLGRIIGEATQPNARGKSAPGKKSETVNQLIEKLEETPKP
ncbi:MAG: hypothetical protein JF599_05620 [Verrucomicrobia bacterium]|nr:hypothetical protein [Verrucomicrobiota bacterium]